MNKCSSYHIEFGRPCCYGTKEKDMCACGGDEAKCDFYPEKRRQYATRVLPTAEMWIAAQKSGRTYKYGDIMYSASRGFFDRATLQPLDREHDHFLSFDMEEFMNFQWAEATITRVEAEKMLGMAIID